MNKKDQTTGDKKRLEIRAIGEIRSSDEEGVCEAYLTKWGAIDSYRTKFEIGSFKNSFEKRGASGIRLFWNHKELAGKILELREEDYGPLAKVKFNLETRAGKEAFEHIKAGDVNCFSFGFNTIKDHWVKGVRSITEVDVMECGPVVFQANDEAIITAIRATDFNQTFEKTELNQRGNKLLSALNYTIEDIYWSGNNPTADEVKGLVDVAISSFHTAYMTWLDEYYMQFEKREGVAPREIRNTIQEVVNTLKISDLTSETSLTTNDLEYLKKGCLLPAESRSKLLDLPEALAEAHRVERRKKIEGLCNELREGGFDQAEAGRFTALLGLNKIASKKEENESEIIQTIDFLKELRSKF